MLAVAWGDMAILEEVLERGRMPILCGGTAMYMRWLARGRPEALHEAEGGIHGQKHGDEQRQQSQVSEEGAGEAECCGAGKAHADAHSLCPLVRLLRPRTRAG